MDLCWVSCYDCTKGSLLMRVGGEGESFELVAAREWGEGRTLSLEETQS